MTRPNTFLKSSLLLAVVPIACVLGGCDIPERPPLDPPPSSKMAIDKKKKPTTAQESVEAPEAEFGADWETWNAYFLSGNQVGYSHISASAILESAVTSGGDSNVQYLFEDQIRFRQDKSTFVQHLVQKSDENSQGVLISFDSSLHVGPTFRSYSGTVGEDILAIETTSGTAKTTRRINWRSTARGLMAVQQSLKRKPMTQGETRTLEMLSPIQYTMIKVNLECTGEVAIPMLDGSFAKVTEIACKYIIDEAGEKVVEQVIWTDEEGMIQKSLRPADGLISYLTDKETALKGATPPAEMVQSTAIAVTGKFERPTESNRTAFVVSPSRVAKRGNNTFSIPALPGQFVRETDGVSQVLVSQTEEIPAGFRRPTLVPDESDLAPTKFVDFGAKRIGQIASTAGTNKNQTEKGIALELTRVAKDWMQQTPSKGFTKASEIADEARGGCYEHSVFLTALLRARKIPTRLVAGFIYVPGENPRMAFHIWNLAHVDGQWLPLDAMVGGVPPADRIALTTTSLANGNEYDAFKPIMDAIGKIEIDIRGARYDAPK